MKKSQILMALAIILISPTLVFSQPQRGEGLKVGDLISNYGRPDLEKALTAVIRRGVLVRVFREERVGMFEGLRVTEVQCIKQISDAVISISPQLGTYLVAGVVINLWNDEGLKEKRHKYSTLVTVAKYRDWTNLEYVPRQSLSLGKYQGAIENAKRGFVGYGGQHCLDMKKDCQTYAYLPTLEVNAVLSKGQCYSLDPYGDIMKALRDFHSFVSAPQAVTFP